MSLIYLIFISSRNVRKKSRRNSCSTKKTITPCHTFRLICSYCWRGKWQWLVQLTNDLFYLWCKDYFRTRSTSLLMTSNFPFRQSTRPCKSKQGWHRLSPRFHVHPFHSTKRWDKNNQFSEKSEETIPRNNYAAKWGNQNSLIWSDFLF